ncbi:hypothetical protein [Acidisoma cladoniae]|uniref:hypothetical protein n=1 Tax=Acidisoma cladoniae TaxID=3040935 RepID=UPI00254CCE9E|nr:hypothetical protein [Acidisoma sp. PAMC 29798]
MTDPEPRPDERVARGAEPDMVEVPASPCLDWQVLLLRYLPEPSSAHAVKRFSAR